MNNVQLPYPARRSAAMAGVGDEGDVMMTDEECFEAMHRGKEAVKKLIAQAVAAERKRCVRIVEQYDGEDCGKSTRARKELVIRIRDGIERRGCGHDGSYG